MDDFKIGESVVPLHMKELTLVVVDIDRKRGVILCRSPKHATNLVQDYLPEELEKEFIIRPPNILEASKPVKDNTRETQE